MRQRRLAIGDFWVASFFSSEFGVRWRVDLPNHSVNPDVVIPGIRVDDGDVAGTWVETAILTENFFSAAGQRTARFNPRSEFATSLPVFGCCARGTAKRLREMALVGETCSERDKRNGFPAT